MGDRTGRDGQDQPRRLRLMVDYDILFANLGRRKSPFAQCNLQGDACRSDILRDDRIAGLDRESFA